MIGPSTAEVGGVNTLAKQQVFLTKNKEKHMN